MPWIRSFMADKQCASKPYVVTEGGYANAVNKDTHNPPEALSGKYMARMYMLFFKNGAPRVCTYELADERPNPEKNDNEAHFGLLPSFAKDIKYGLRTYNARS